MFNSMRDALVYALQWEDVKSLDDRNRLIIVRDLYLNAQDEREAISIINLWTN